MVCSPVEQHVFAFGRLRENPEAAFSGGQWPLAAATTTIWEPRWTVSSASEDERRMNRRFGLRSAGPR
jgi:hypothetical protein